VYDWEERVLIIFMFIFSVKLNICSKILDIVEKGPPTGEDPPQINNQQAAPAANISTANLSFPAHGPVPIATSSNSGNTAGKLIITITILLYKTLGPPSTRCLSSAQYPKARSQDFTCVWLSLLAS